MTKEERKEYMRRWRDKNRDKLNLQDRIRYHKNPKKFRLRCKTYHQNHPNYSKEYYLKNRERELANGKILTKKYRIDALSFYSNGKMECECCKERQYEFLSIDHINGGGNKHRKSMRGNSFYKYLKRENYPDGYQVLCHNCNQAKGLYGKCPHQK